VEYFSPELRLTLALLRAALGSPPSLPTVAKPIDWAIFVATLERHRVGAFLYRQARPRLEAACPGLVVQQIREIANAVNQRALNQAAEQIRLMKALGAGGVDVKTVKGLVLGQRLYGQLGTRHVGDIDLWVQPADVARADLLLRAAGLTRSRPDLPLTPLQFKKFVQLKPEFEYRGVSRSLRVELLWRLEGLPDHHVPWKEAATSTIGGYELRTLPPQVDALYLLQHGARHGWFRLFWLVDAALLLRDPKIHWPAVMIQARQLGLERPVLQAAALVETLFGISRPTALMPRGHEKAIVATLCAEASRQIAREPQEHERVGEWARQLGYRLRLQKSVAQKFSVLAPHFFTPESWRTWPLPDRWFFLYYFLTPFLWFWRRLRRTA